MTSLAGSPIFKGKSFAPKRASAQGVNSWDMTLTAGQSVVGLTEEVTLYPSVSIALLTDGSGTVFLDQSTDGINFDDVEAVDVAAGNNTTFVRIINRRFYRTRFVSSSLSAHTFFRLQTMYGDFTSDGLGVGDSGQALRAVNILVEDTELSVPATTPTTIVTLTPAIETFITGIFCSGNDYAKYTIEVNSIIKFTKRSGPSRDAFWDFGGGPLRVIAASVLDVRIEHFYTGDVGDYDATILGYT